CAGRRRLPGPLRRFCEETVETAATRTHRFIRPPSLQTGSAADKTRHAENDKSDIQSMDRTMKKSRGGTVGAAPPLLHCRHVQGDLSPCSGTCRHLQGTCRHVQVDDAACRWAASASAFVLWIVPNGCSGGA